MWYPLAVDPQTRRNGGYFESAGWVCVNIETRLMTTHVHSSKTFAYSECNKRNGNKEQLKFEVNDA